MHAAEADDDRCPSHWLNRPFRRYCVRWRPFPISRTEIPMSDLSRHVRNYVGQKRYELQHARVTAIAVYEIRGGSFAITHTEVPSAASGQGIGSALIEGALTDIRKRDLKLLPLFPFVVAYLERRPKDDDLVDIADTR